MRHIHTSIVSRHLAQEVITKYCAHLHHTLAALKRYFPASLVVPLPSSEQTNLPSSNHTCTKSTPKHIHHHYAPSVISTHTTHIISSTAPTYAPHCRPWICGQTPPEWLHCWPDGQRSWLVDHKREHRTPPPLARVMGVGRQQQQLKNIGPKANRWLMPMLNKCFMENKIPTIWRQSQNIAIRNPGKDCNSKMIPTIYLVCQTHKPYERMILNKIAPTIELHLIKEHDGFRTGKLFTSQLLNIAQHIQDG